MDPPDLTVRILQDIREEIRGSREEQRAFREQVAARFEAVDKRFEAVDRRFEVVETTLRDMAQQFVILGRGVKTLLERGSRGDDRLDDLERRVDDLERRVPAG